MEEDKRPQGGRVLDMTARLLARAAKAERQRARTAHAPSDPEPDAHKSERRPLGEREDGTIDLAAWRAKWRPIYKVDFVMGDVSEGSLHFFHDKRSSSLEFMAVDHEGHGFRHVLQTSDAMQLLMALNAAFGFDPKGPNGERLAGLYEDDNDPGPMCA